MAGHAARTAEEELAPRLRLRFEWLAPLEAVPCRVRPVPELQLEVHDGAREVREAVVLAGEGRVQERVVFPERLHAGEDRVRDGHRVLDRGELVREPIDSLVAELSTHLRAVDDGHEHERLERRLDPRRLRDGRPQTTDVRHAPVPEERWRVRPEEERRGVAGQDPSFGQPAGRPGAGAPLTDGEWQRLGRAGEGHVAGRASDVHVPAQDPVEEEELTEAEERIVRARSTVGGHRLTGAEVRMNAGVRPQIGRDAEVEGSREFGSRLGKLHPLRLASEREQEQQRHGSHDSPPAPKATPIRKEIWPPPNPVSAS